jgi:AraC-like DNA-binding protein
MDLIAVDGAVTVAGPDTAAFAIEGGTTTRGLRFRPGMLPRLLAVPAVELANRRTELTDLTTVGPSRPASLVALAELLASRQPSRETAPWSIGQLMDVSRALAHGATVGAVADDLGWSRRTFHRQSLAVYGYGPGTLRRVLRFRRATRLLINGMPAGDVAAAAGYADQPHLYREVRALAGVPLNQFASGAKRSTVVPSGSATVA